MTRATIDAELAGVRADVALARLAGTSRSRAATWIAQGRATVDGRSVDKNHRLALGQELAWSVASVAPTDPAAAPPLPPVRYEDEDLLVVAKPAGLVVHPGAGHPDGTLVDALRAAHVPLAPAGGPERPGIVHRLDRDTSGLLLVAKTDRAHAALVAALRARRVERAYLALVDGVPEHPRARVEAPIGRDPDDRLRFAVVAGGREAVTRYEVVARGEVALADRPGDVALLVCRLQTGRTHQLRVHLASLDHPVCGDATYRADRHRARELGLQRPFLHAATLGLEHPVTREPLRLHEPPPEDLWVAARLAGVADAIPAEP